MAKQLEKRHRGEPGPDDRGVGATAESGSRPSGREQRADAAAGLLAAYHAEIRETENRWHGRNRYPGLGQYVSFWNREPRLLKELNRRHGIQPDDPRVYSI